MGFPDGKHEAHVATKLLLGVCIFYLITDVEDVSVIHSR